MTCIWTSRCPFSTDASEPSQPSVNCFFPAGCFAVPQSNHCTGLTRQGPGARLMRQFDLNIGSPCRPHACPGLPVACAVESVALSTRHLVRTRCSEFHNLDSSRGPAWHGPSAARVLQWKLDVNERRRRLLDPTVGDDSTGSGDCHVCISWAM